MPNSQPNVGSPHLLAGAVRAVGDAARADGAAGASPANLLHILDVGDVATARCDHSAKRRSWAQPLEAEAEARARRGWRSRRRLTS